MRKTGLHLFIFMMVIVFAVSVGFAAEKSFKAKLSGSQCVPPVKTKAKGDVEFKLSNDANAMSFKLNVKDIENVTAAHIHLGAKGKNGPPVANLFTGPKKEGIFSGTLADGTLTDENLMGSLAGKPLSSLVDMIKKGNAYVNVHTDKYPDGELRGQIK